jgi:peroxiredoxin
MAQLVSRVKQLWQNKWFNNGVWLIAFIVLYLLLRPLMQGDVVREQAPDFSATTLSGKQIRLSDYQGQPVLVHFWATWCPICEFSRDGIEDISQDYAVLNIATQSGDRQALLAYAEQHGMNPDNIVLDEDGSLFNLYGARAVPADFIINSQGQVEFVEVGLSSSWGLRLRLAWTD